MRALPFVLLAVLGACGGDARTPAAGDSSTLAAGQPDASGAAGAFAGVTGRWAVHAFRDGSDISYVSYTLTATADSAGWSVTFPGRDPMPVVVRAGAADSFVVELGPYPSVVRPDVRVRAVTTGTSSGDRMDGRFDAHYDAGGADSVVRGRFEGTRLR